MHIEFIRIGETLERRATAATSMIAGLSFSEARLLSPLIKAGERGLTRGQLAEQSHLTASAVSRALKPLEKSGFVETRRDERDSRNARATLTAAGEGRLNDALRAVDDLWESLDFTKLGLTPAILASISEHLSTGRRIVSTPEQRLVGKEREAAQAKPVHESAPPSSLNIPSRPGIKIG